MMDAPVLDPYVVTVTNHAIQRYAERRNTNPDWISQGIWLLLTKAAQKPTPPLRLSCNGAVRRYRVGGYCLVMSSDLSTLITLYRDHRMGRIAPR